MTALAIPKLGSTLILGLATSLLLAPPVKSHSWGEAQYRIARNGTFVGEAGYSRGYQARDENLIEADVQWLIPKDPESNKAVRPDIGNLTETFYSTQFPMLHVAPGDWVAFTYLENGHVTMPDKTNCKPINRGTIYIYGTRKNDLSGYDLEDIHLKWTNDGTGGDGMGKLLATRHFDDGQCFQPIPKGGDVEGITTHRMRNTDGLGKLDCQSDFQIPLDLKSGEEYTVLWVWDWPLLQQCGRAIPPADYNMSPTDIVKQPEIYTSVADYKIVDPCSPELGEVKGPTCRSSSPSTIDFASRPYIDNRTAVKSQMENHFLVQVAQAGFEVNQATACNGSIPMAGLIGHTDLVSSSLPAAMFTPASLSRIHCAPRSSDPTPSGVWTSNTPATALVGFVTVTTTVTTVSTSN